MGLRGRPPDPDLRDRLIVAATALFLERGFAATGVEAVAGKAGVTKGALFHYFPTKADLVAAALGAWVAGGRAMYASGPLQADLDPVRKAIAYVEFTAAVSEHPSAPLGCLIGLASAELAEADPVTRAFCGDALDTWAAELAALVRAAMPDDATWSPDEVAAHFVAVFEGGQILSRAHGDRAHVARHLRLFGEWLATRLGRTP